MQLKSKNKSGHWQLINIGADEFTADELKPFEKVMEVYNIKILKPGEKVIIPGQLTKEYVMSRFVAAQQTLAPDAVPAGDTAQ